MADDLRNDLNKLAAETAQELRKFEEAMKSRILAHAKTVHDAEVVNTSVALATKGGGVEVRIHVDYSDGFHASWVMD